MNFICEIEESQEYVELNIVNKVKASRLMVLHKLGRKLHNLRIIFSTRPLIAINLLLSISSIRTKHDFITVQIQKKFILSLKHLLTFSDKN